MLSRNDRSGRGRAQRLRRGRFLRTELLEPRLLLATAQGISPSELSELAAVYAGFDFSEIEARNVYVVDSADLTAAALREAVAAAQEAAGADMIVIRTTDVSHTVTFSDANDAIAIHDASSLLLAAVGDESLIVDAAGYARSFYIGAGSSVMLGNLTLTGGSADNGGAIYNEGNLTLVGSTVSSNIATLEGGGIYSVSELTMINTVVSGNRASGNGGGILLTGSFDADAPIANHSFVNCTITGNRAGLDESGKGGGIYFTGQDADYNVYSNLVLNNSIIVDNRSATTSIDENIYNSIFELSFDGEAASEVIPVPWLIDGDNNLTTFVYWVSYYDPDDPSQTGTNAVYNESIPLFERFYDFDRSIEGDYSLTESSISQAIDKGDNAKAVFKNKTDISIDRSGNTRIQNDCVDIGAYEFDFYVDLAAADGGTLSNEYVVVGGGIRISDIRCDNNGARASEAATVRFYASEDENILDTDIFLGEIQFESIAGNTSRTFDSGTLLTSSLTAGRSYYLGWIVDSFSDADESNNDGQCLTRLHLFAESSSPEIVNLEQSSYTVQEGCCFFLSTTELPEPETVYWWSFGSGAFTEGNPADWLMADGLGLACGGYTVQLKIVSTETKSVVAVGFATLNVIWSPPTVSVKKSTILDGQILKVALNAFMPNGQAAEQWTINWGDGGDPQVFDSVSNALKAAHYYAKSEKTRTYAVTLTLVDTNGSGGDVSYVIASHTVEGNQTPQALSVNAAEDTPSDDTLQQAVVEQIVNDPLREELNGVTEQYNPQIFAADYVIEIQPNRTASSSVIDDTRNILVVNITVKGELLASEISISVAGYESCDWLREFNRRLSEKISDAVFQNEYEFDSDAIGEYSFALPIAFPPSNDSNEEENVFDLDSEQWQGILADCFDFVNEEFLKKRLLI